MWHAEHSRILTFSSPQLTVLRHSMRILLERLAAAHLLRDAEIGSPDVNDVQFVPHPPSRLDPAGFRARLPNFHHGLTAGLLQIFKIRCRLAVGMIDRISPDVIERCGIILGFRIEVRTRIDSNYRVRPVLERTISPDPRSARLRASALTELLCAPADGSNAAAQTMAFAAYILIGTCRRKDTSNRTRRSVGKPILHGI